MSVQYFMMNYISEQLYISIQDGESVFKRLEFINHYIFKL